MHDINKKYIIIWSTAAVVVLILIGVWLRIANLGSVDFQNDEYYHVEAAQGYIETGHFELWDFVEKRTIDPYKRAWPYTWIVAQSFKLFGSSEWSARLPSAIFGILLLPLIYFLAFKVSKSRLVGLLSLLLVVFDASFVWSSRVCRMYSMFVFFIIIASYLIYQGLENKNKKINYYYLVAGALLFVFSYMLHEAALLLALGWLLYFILNIRKNKFYLLSAVCGLAGLAGFIIIHSFITPLMSADFITLRVQPNFEYFYYPFNQLHAVYLGWFIVVMGLLLLWKNRESIKIYYVSLFMPIVLFFVFFAARYAAKKYMLLILPFILIFYVDSFYLLIKKIITKKLFYPVFIILFFFAGPLFSFPSVEPNALFQLARADQSYYNFKLHNYSRAYKYIEDNYQDNEPILILHKRSYYFSKKDYNFISLKKDKEFELKELEAIIKNNDSGWVVWPRYKEDLHIRKKVARYCEKNLKKIKVVKGTNIQIYKW